MFNWDIDRFQDAWLFATRKHQEQSYGSYVEGQRVSYLNHLAAVATEVQWALQRQSAGLDADLALACALLHDCLEDTPTRLEELRDAFGERLARAVLALTKNTALPDKRAQMEDSLRRILEFGPEAALVKMADRVCNLYAPAHYWDRAKILAYQDEARLIHAQLAHAHGPMAERLASKIGLYSRFL